MGPDSNNSTLGCLTKQPCATVFAPLLALESLLHLIGVFVMQSGIASGGKATHPECEICSFKAHGIEAICCISTTQENNFRPKTL
jgi:hypothetical protein